MREYQNYHRHSCYTNIKVSDSVTTNADYAQRAVDLGHKLISSCEHGWQGRYIECYELAKQHGLKFLEASEAYWVKDRFEKDRSNCHIFLGAKSEKGRRALNSALAEANITGFYGQPRLDIPLLLSLPPDDIWVTTACIAYWRYDDIDDITKRFRDHFGNNFFLEVQYHAEDKQRRINEHILDLRATEHIPIIMGCDSHYILPGGGADRSDYIASKGMTYPDESGFILDYPDGNIAYQRFVDQGVLDGLEIEEAMANTNVFLQVEDYDCACFTKDIKMPTLYPGLSQEERNQKYDDVIWSAWSQEKVKIPSEMHDRYEQEIRLETDIVHTTKHADYFLDDHAIVKRGIELGGVLTSTGRGSAVSFYTNKLLGLTEVDRIAAKVKMYPERFMSPTRILEAKTLADVDLNVADRAPFLQAQKEIMGEESSYEMIAYGTMKPKAAWKMYARSQAVDFQVANDVSEQIERYENALKHASEDDKDSIDIMDYIEPRYQDLFEKSKQYQGVISHVTPHPCATLLYQGNIREEIGLINVKGVICCIMDGKWAEDYKFLKNDWLKVSVVDLIDRVYKRIGIQRHTVDELLALCPPADPVWDIYKKSCTLGINQVEQAGTSKRVSVYAPTNISELCAFVAAIRPGFKSMYKIFEGRQPFSYNIKALDDLLQTPEMPNSFVLYQESSMAVLNYAGIPMSECYEIIKNIAKKRVQKVLKYKEQFLEGFKTALIEKEGQEESHAEKLSHDVWQILEDSSAYAFNCVSGNTRIGKPGGENGKYIPTIAEMYKLMHDPKYASQTGHRNLRNKFLRNGYGIGFSLQEDDAIYKNKIVDIYPMGIQKTYKVRVETGQEIVCTADHRFPTPNGKKRLSELANGDILYVMGDRVKKAFNARFTDDSYTGNFPQKGQMGFQTIPDANTVLYHMYREDCCEKRRSCEDCDVAYDEKIRFEVHHVDFDRTHNTLDNYAWLCASCHKKRHYRHGRTKQYENGIPVEESRIVSIEYVGEEEVYDVEMAAPYHNFVLDNGLVTSNCSHSYCVAIDSLYGAYLKTYYPLQFYETFLRVMEEKGDKDRLNAGKEEAEDYFKVKFPPFRYGQDNRAITADLTTYSITNSLSSIKGFGSEMGNIFYECSLQPHDNFIDVLKWLNGHSIKSARIQPLVNIGYFDSFGNIPELSRIIALFDFFKQGDAKQIKKEKVAGSAIQDLLGRFATDKNAKGVEMKSFTIVDMAGLLSSCEDYVKSLGMADLPLKTKLANQVDVLGYADLTTNKEEDRRKLLVTDLVPLKGGRSNDVWAYAIFTKSIGSGKTSRLTLRAEAYNKLPFKKSDIIYAESIAKERSGYWYLYTYHLEF